MRMIPNQLFSLYNFFINNFWIFFWEKLNCLMESWNFPNMSLQMLCQLCINNHVIRTLSWHTGIFQKIRHCIKLVVFLIKSLLLTNLGENILVHGKNKLLLMNIYHHFFIWIRNLLPNQIEYWVVFQYLYLFFLFYLIIHSLIIYNHISLISFIAVSIEGSVVYPNPLQFWINLLSR